MITSKTELDALVKGYGLTHDKVEFNPQGTSYIYLTKSKTRTQIVIERGNLNPLFVRSKLQAYKTK